MEWTSEKLNAFKNYFGLTDKDIASGINESVLKVWKMRNGETSIKKYIPRLTGYMQAVVAGKIKQQEQMIEYYKSFK